MSDKYRVVFAAIESQTSKEDIASQISQKLKITEQKVLSFFDKKPLFAVSSKEKCLKQAKLLASYGVKTKLVCVSQPSQSNENRDQRVFDALDYITSSLIRIEERLEDIEQRLSDEKITEKTEDSEWDNELLDEIDFIPSEKVNKTRKVQYVLGAVLVLLCIVLVFALLYPELITF
jgi:hypothetical protein